MHVIFDLTALATPIRDRGIGRYLMETALALERAASSRRSLKVGFLERSDWMGPGVVRPSAEQVITSLLASKPRAERTEWAYRNRVGMWRALRHAGGELLHLGFANVTPWGLADRIVTCHDLIPLQYPAQYLGWRQGFAAGRRLADLRRYAGARHIIAISAATADALTHLLRIPSSHISVVHNGVSLERWSEAAHASDADVRGRYDLGERALLVYAGDADFRKNAEGMLAALKVLKARQPERGFLLAWAGRLGLRQQQRITALAEVLGVQNDVKLLGYIPDADLAALYRQAFATLFVSRAEGFGYPVIEALACGSPVVTSNRSSLVELAGDVAACVDPESPDAIAEAVLASENSEQHERRRARRAWAERFSLERQAGETLDVYERVLRHSSP
jgi:glycosyltransferase involved in cell wall biosynthesis